LAQSRKTQRGGDLCPYPQHGSLRDHRGVAARGTCSRPRVHGRYRGEPRDLAPKPRSRGALGDARARAQIHHAPQSRAHSHGTKGLRESGGSRARGSALARYHAHGRTRGLTRGDRSGGIHHDDPPQSPKSDRTRDVNLPRSIGKDDEHGDTWGNAAPTRGVSLIDHI